MNATRPTKKQRELLSFIEGFIRERGYGPSYREVMHALGYKSVSTVASHIDNLIKRGHLNKRDNSARSLEVLHTTANEPKTSEQQDASTQERWLMQCIDQKFRSAEKMPKHSQVEIDELNILIGALSVLGFETAASVYKDRLRMLFPAPQAES